MRRVFTRSSAQKNTFKALLQEQMVPFPKTHDLELLLDLLTPAAPELNAVQSAAQSLADYSGIPLSRHVGR